MKTSDLKKEIEKKFKPKVLRVDKLKEDKVILTDTYSWRDFREAISEAVEQALSTQKQEFEKMLDELKRIIRNCIDNHKLSADMVANRDIVFAEDIKKALYIKLQELKSKLELK
jgi:hypothetical protein